MSVNHELETFISKHNIVDLLPKLSESTKRSILSDLKQSQRTVTNKSVDQGTLSMINQSVDQGTLYIFTDGGCKRNGNRNPTAAYSVFFTENSDSPLFQFNTTQQIFTEPTNNRAELSGILYIFKTVYENKTLFQNQNIIICTDSMYSINCIEKWSKNWLSNNWKNAKGQEVKNKELIREILNYHNDIKNNTGLTIKFKHIFSHTAAPSDTNTLSYYLWFGNNKVDENINKLLG
jgi:ribonuclease HI